MGAVVMQRVLPGSRNLQGTSAVTLVDSQGCRVPAMKSVCPEQPRQSNPLTTTMSFRAFMFQGAQSGDEMILSVRMLGCLHYEDCYKTRSCEEKAVGRHRTKRSRQSGPYNETTDLQTFLEFRVALPGESRAAMERQSWGNSHATTILCLGLMCSIGAVAIAVYIVKSRKSN